MYFQWPFTTLLATLHRALCCSSGTGDQEVAQFLECFRSFKTSVSTNSLKMSLLHRRWLLRSMGLFLSMQLVGWWGILTAGQSKPICWYWKAPGTTWLPYHCDCNSGCCTVWSYALKALRPWWCGLLVLCSNEGWICALFCLHPFAAGSSRVCWICFMIPSAQFDFYILRRHQSAGRWQLQEYGHLHSCSCTCSLAGFLCEVPCQFAY